MDERLLLYFFYPFSQLNERVIMAVCEIAASLWCIAAELGDFKMSRNILALSAGISLEFPRPRESAGEF